MSDTEPNLPKHIEKKLQQRKKDLLAAKAAQLGIDPFEILLHLAAGDAQTLRMFRTDRDGNQVTNTETGEPVPVNINAHVRLGAASEACSYIYPKLKAVEHSVDEDQFNERGQQILNEVVASFSRSIHPNAPTGLPPGVNPSDLDD